MLYTWYKVLNLHVYGLEVMEKKNIHENHSKCIAYLLLKKSDLQCMQDGTSVFFSFPSLACFHFLIDVLPKSC